LGRFVTLAVVELFDKLVANYIETDRRQNILQDYKISRLYNLEKIEEAQKQ